METTDMLERARNWPLSLPPQRLTELVDSKLAIARQYDVLGINRAVAICVWLEAAPSFLPATWTGTMTSSCCRSCAVAGYILSSPSSAISRLGKSSFCIPFICKRVRMPTASL